MNTIIEIDVCNPKGDIRASIYVEQIAENRFRAEENELFLELTKGTEFETETDENGIYKIIRITKTSEYNTQTFLLNLGISEAEYRVIGDEIIKQGGYWQVDFGGIATVNLPKNSTLNIDALLKRLGQ